MTEPAATQDNIYLLPEPSIVSPGNVVNMTGEPIPPPAKPKRKYTRKTAKARAKRASKVNAAIMPKPSIGVQTLKDGQAGDAISAWSPPVPHPSMMRSIYDLLTPPGGNQGTRIFRRSERFWFLLLSTLAVSLGTTAAVYWW